jgi:hypothetical protein
MRVLVGSDRATRAEDIMPAIGTEIAAISNTGTIGTVIVNGIVTGIATTIDVSSG